MYIHIDLDSPPGAAELREPEQFTEFHVMVSGADDSLEAVEAAAVQVGRVAGPEHVFVEVELLKRIAGNRSRQQEWLSQLEGMIDYAREKGWTDATGNLRAHVERTDGDAEDRQV